MMNDLGKYIRLWRVGRGFVTPNSLDTEQERDQMLGKLMLTVTEIAEMAEAVRENNVPHFCEELADTFIRLLDISSTMNIDIEAEIRSKMAFNDTRPLKHGKFSSL